MRGEHPHRLPLAGRGFDSLLETDGILLICLLSLAATSTVEASDLYLRRMPARIAGETTDVDGRRGFVLTLQTREQHIRREKATHNICTAQALNALAGVIYLSWLGRRGLVELGELLLQRTAYARDRSPRSTASSCSRAARRARVRASGSTRRSTGDRALRRRGRQPRLPARRDQESDGLLVAITEQRSREDIDRLAEVLGAAVAAEREAATA